MGANACTKPRARINQELYATYVNTPSTETIDALFDDAARLPENPCDQVLTLRNTFHDMLGAGFVIDTSRNQIGVTREGIVVSVPDPAIPTPLAQD